MSGYDYTYLYGMDDRVGWVKNHCQSACFSDYKNSYNFQEKWKITLKLFIDIWFTTETYMNKHILALSKILYYFICPIIIVTFSVWNLYANVNYCGKWYYLIWQNCHRHLIF